MIAAARWGGAWRPRLGWLLVSGSALFCASEAQAVLGETVDTVKADQVRFGGARRQSAVQRMTTHEISLADGSIIKEYVNAAGVVFAVSWRSRLKPDLAKLLGSNFTLLAAGNTVSSGVASSKMQRSVRQTNLVLHQGGRMNAFAGLAYVPNLVPKGLDADTLR